MPTIRAIPTKYSGVSFRSRLEARWAVFFDTLGVEWEYEPEGFQLSTGERYLPDFWLPVLKMYAEVKPVGGDTSKPLAFCAESGAQLWLCIGQPSSRWQPILNGAWQVARITCKHRASALWWGFGEEMSYDAAAEARYPDPYVEGAVSAAKSHRFGT